MANQVIGLDVEIKVNNALAELRKLSPGADKEAKAIAGSLSKALKDAEKQAQATGRALQKTAEATKQVSAQTADLGANGNKALKALGPLGGVLGRLSPEAGAAASSIAGLTSAFEGFEAAGLASLSPLLTAAIPLLGALGIAVVEVAMVMDDYTAATKEAERANKLFKDAITPLADALKQAKAEQQKLNEAAAAANPKEALEALDAKTRAQGKAAEASKELLADQAAQVEILKTEANWQSVTGQLAQNRLEKIQEQITAIDAEALAFETLTDANKKQRAELGVVVPLVVKHTEAVKKQTDGIKDLNEQLQRETDLNERNTATYRSSIAALNETEAQAKRAMATKAEQMALDHTAAIQRINDLNHDVQFSAVTDSAKENSAAETRAAIKAVDAAYYAELDAMRAEDAAKADEASQVETDKAAELRAAELDAERAIAQAGVDLALQGLDTVSQATTEAAQREAEQADKLQAQLVAGDAYYTDSQKAELQKRIAEHRKAAATAFGIAKAARIAEATITTAMAVVNALNDGLAVGGPAGLILGPVSAAAAGIAGGIQIAAIAAEQPSFHQGYAPDERNARVLTSEAVLSPAATAALGSGNIAAANAGIMGGGRQASTPVVFRHQTFRPFIKDFLTQPSALSTALNAGKIVGHRARN